MVDEYSSRGVYGSVMTISQKNTDQVIWICRHGNRIDFVDPSWKGPDPHLSPDGVTQAKKTGRRLWNEGIQHIFASPFLRTIETAHHIAEALDLSIKIEHGVCEWLNPQWFSQTPDLMPPDGLCSLFPRIDLNYTSAVNPRYPETLDECMDRCHRTARWLASTYESNILVVGHGASVEGIVKGLVEHNEGISVDLCALFKVGGKNKRYSLEIANDTSHLFTK